MPRRVGYFMVVRAVEDFLGRLLPPEEIKLQLTRDRESPGFIHVAINRG